MGHEQAPQESLGRKQVRADAIRLGLLPFPAIYDDPMMENDYDGRTAWCFKCRKPIRARAEISHVSIYGIPVVRAVHKGCRWRVEAEDLYEHLRAAPAEPWE